MAFLAFIAALLGSSGLTAADCTNGFEVGSCPSKGDGQTW